MGVPPRATSDCNGRNNPLQLAMQTMLPMYYLPLRDRGQCKFLVPSGLLTFSRQKGASLVCDSLPLDRVTALLQILL